MKLNTLEQKILNSLEIGENNITITQLSLNLDICRPTIIKYIKLLEYKKFIKKITSGLKGGTTNDPTKQTIIIRIK